jgi:hypothetical protein
MWRDGVKGRLQIVLKKILQTAYSTFLLGVSPCTCCILSCLVSMAVNCPGCICSCLVGTVAILWVLVVLCVYCFRICCSMYVLLSYLLFYVCTVFVLVVLCVYCCRTCCFMCVLLSYLLFYVCIVVLLVLCVYCCRTCCSMCVLLSYLLYYVCIAGVKCRTAGWKSAFGRSCDRPPRHR